MWQGAPWEVSAIAIEPASWPKMHIIMRFTEDDIVIVRDTAQESMMNTLGNSLFHDVVNQT